MAYNWAQLAFVEKWRLQAVRGLVIGMYRPEDKTFFDLRLRPEEGGAGRLAGPVELHLLDAGDMIREKRVALLARVPVVVRVVASQAAGPAQGPNPSDRPRSRRMLEPGSRIPGKVLQAEDDTALLDVGLPVVVQLPDTAHTLGLRPGGATVLTVSETPKGFIVL